MALMIALASRVICVEIRCDQARGRQAAEFWLPAQPFQLYIEICDCETRTVQLHCAAEDGPPYSFGNFGQLFYRAVTRQIHDGLFEVSCDHVDF